VLVVEDEQNIRELICLHLDLEQFDCAQAADGTEALRLARERPFDLVILDLMLPGLDGMSICRAIRREGPNVDVPILMLTARREESDKVLGLESGADDYLTKPFGVRELVARVRALLRRARRTVQQDRQSEAAEAPLTAGPLTIDAARRLVHRDGQPIELTLQEFTLLRTLAAEPGIVFSRERLLKRVWKGDTHVTTRSVDTLVKRLRQKIEIDAAHPSLILTVWGSGYKFADA
jgi:DNA-binding response OmpR family regulator